MKIFEITLLLLGSIIGAGFATGAEIVTFFGYLQLPTWVIALIVGLVMSLIIILEVVISYPNQTQQKTLQQKTTTCKFLYLVFVIIYLILYTVMTAGITQLTNTWICLVSLVLCIHITLFGFQKLSKLNSFIVLIIIVLIITTTLPHLSFKKNFHYNYQHTFDAFYWALLYAGLNCFMYPELIKALAQIHKRRTIILAGIITSLIVAILFGLILSVIKLTNTQTALIPLLAVAPNPITMVVILLAVLSSQYTALFAIIQRLQIMIPATKNKPLLTATLISFLALIGSYCGFNHIIKFTYPLIGGFTCFYLLFSFLLVLRHHSH